MYDDLVKRLREIHPEKYDDEWEFAYDCQRAMNEAADAIEELSEKAMPNGKHMETEKYVAISDVYDTLTEKYHHTLGVQHEALKEALAAVPAADVLPRDEAIKMGADLAAMHNATPDQQQLEKAYLDGLEEGMKRRDVRPVVKATWEQVEVRYGDELIDNPVQAVASMFCPNCQRYHNEVYFYGMPTERVNFCSNCGADMQNFLGKVAANSQNSLEKVEQPLK